jgi:type VI secretion system secreted protein VgrG
VGYKIFFAGGAVKSGTLNDQGQARHDDVPEIAERVEYEARTPEQDTPWAPLDELIAAARKKLG